MDKRKYENNENVHDLLAEAMQEACTKDEAYDYKSPDIDLSFLNEDTANKKRFGRFGKIAAIVAIILLGMNVVLLSGNFSESYGDKGILHRIQEGVRGIFTDEDQSEFATLDENDKVIIINDFTEIEIVKRFLNDLLIPKYIPNNYNFEKLEITYIISGDYNAEYLFLDGENEIIISISYGDFSEKIISKDAEKVIRKDDRIINIYKENIKGMFVAEMYKDNIIVAIYSNSDIDELELIAMNLN